MCLKEGKNLKEIVFLVLNILAIISYVFLSKFLDISLAIFVVLHNLFISILLLIKSRIVILLGKFVNYIGLILLTGSAGIVFSILIESLNLENLEMVSYLLRLVPAVLSLILVFHYMLTEVKKWYTNYIMLDMALVSFVMILLLVDKPESTGSFIKLLLNSNIIASIMVGIGVILVVLGVSTFIFLIKYREKYFVESYLLISLLFMMISYLALNIFYVLGLNYNEDVALLMTVLSAVIFYFLYQPFTNYSVAEMIEDGGVMFRIGLVKKSATSYISIFFALAVFLVYNFKAINQLTFVMLLGGIVVYQIISWQVNNTILNDLLIQKELVQKNHMNEIIKQRNEEMIRSNAKLRFIAAHDSLTRLPNRDSFLKDAENLINEEKKNFSFVLLTTENMRVIRNLHGTEVFNRLVVLFLNRLREIVEPKDSIYRLSKYEFGIVSMNESMDFFENFYSSVHILSDLEYKVDELRLPVNLKIGFCRYPTDVKTVKELLSVADSMAFIYREGTRFQEELRNAEVIMQNLSKKNKYSTYLREADYDKEFQLYYQPQFDIVTKEVIGAEALIRWIRDGEFISPGIFIPIAETIGLIQKISDWVAKEAVEQAIKWKSKVNEGFRIGINISPIILKNNEFVENFYNYVDSKPVSYEMFDFEITEYMELSNTSDLFVRLRNIREKGINISIDDFGTGYSSLSYINMYKINKLKIAKELIDHICTSTDEKSIVMAIIQMASSTGMQTIAEGVEEQNQLEALREFGCDQIQGYIWGRPVPVDEFEKMYLE